MPKKKEVAKDQPLLPAAQDELDQKVQHVVLKAGRVQAFGTIELIARELKLKEIREVVENSEVLKIKGFKSLEDFFDYLGISRQTGFNRKKIVEAFSDEEVQLLYSMGFSQRGVLKLASLPAEMLPAIQDTDDPAELKSQIEDLLADIEKEKNGHSKDVKALYKRIDNQEKDIKDYKERTDRFQRLYPEDDFHWVKINRQVHSEYWDHFLSEFSAFVLNERAIMSDEAQDYMADLYDRITGNLFDLNEHYKQRTGGRSFMRAK